MMRKKAKAGTKVAKAQNGTPRKTLIGRIFNNKSSKDKTAVQLARIKARANKKKLALEARTKRKKISAENKANRRANRSNVTVIKEKTTPKKNVKTTITRTKNTPVTTVKTTTKKPVVRKPTKKLVTKPKKPVVTPPTNIRRTAPKQTPEAIRRRLEEIKKTRENLNKSKSGTKVKKATYGKTMKAKSGTKTKMKKAKSGSTLKKAPAGSKGKGMRSLPKAVRNKIGFAKKGKTVKKAGYGTKAKKAKMGCSTRRKKK